MGRPDGEPRRLEVPNLRPYIDALGKEVVGQDAAVESFARLIAKIKSGIRPTEPRPIDVKMLLGPSGSGKDTLVVALARVLGADFPDLHGDASELILRIDGGEFKSEARVNNLIGSPPGYVNAKGTKEETEPVFSQKSLDEHRIYFLDRKREKRSVVIILVDEIEKAHKSLDEAMLAVMQEGSLRMSDNTMTDFRDTVVIFTSNIGNGKVGTSRRKRADAPGLKLPAVFDYGLKDVELDPGAIADYEQMYLDAYREGFVDEFRGRVREVCVFRHLDKESLREIARVMLDRVEESFWNSEVNLRIIAEQTVLDWLVQKSYDPNLGARALSGFIERVIYEPLVTVGAEDLDKSQVTVKLAGDAQGVVFSISELPEEQLLMAEE